MNLVTADPRVLVVDDDQNILKVIESMLLSNGYHPEVFDSPLDLLDAIGPDDTGCVVTDLDMPGITGTELQVRLRLLESCLAVIVISGQADVPSAITVMSRGAVTLIEKPFRAAELAIEVEHACRLSVERFTRREKIRNARRAISLLNEEELEILKMGARGLPNKAVSHELALSPRTVDRRRQSAFTKLGVNSEGEFLVILNLADENI